MRKEMEIVDPAKMLITSTWGASRSSAPEMRRSAPDMRRYAPDMRRSAPEMRQFSVN
jgi:hypothetical protein